MKTLFIMVGISGSGKSVFAEKLVKQYGYPCFSSDEIRGELCNGDLTDQSKNGEVFRLLYERVEGALCKGDGAIADATSVKPDDRNKLRKIAINTGAQIIMVVMNTGLEECRKLNEARSRVVPNFVIDKQWKAYVPPHINEANEIWYVNWEENAIYVQRPNQFAFVYFEKGEFPKLT